ncbi:hypothetical protein Y032_0002g626 [Ancylostoma ceylanicum]|uniref:G-protein coupled receptors family 1 profile domain-containing protein n=1 Tax=Ancylostoma ceylanicum TaxID=53326 RepID=A0A016VZZ2_9BILA|nr:hypothetical protein Y032_0002g626 [Ancylostoma ceylanicum]
MALRAQVHPYSLSFLTSPISLPLEVRLRRSIHYDETLHVDMELIGLGFKIFYIVVPACGITGNTIIIMATIKYKQLRSSCNILIAAIAIGDILHQAGFVITVLLHELLVTYSYSYVVEESCLIFQHLFEAFELTTHL